MVVIYRHIYIYIYIYYVHIIYTYIYIYTHIQKQLHSGDIKAIAEMKSDTEQMMKLE